MQNKILELLKETKDYLSGAQLGEQLGVSRAAIWKGIQKLRKEGYEIDAITNRGYRLVMGQELYNAVEIQDGLETKIMGQKIFFYEETDSTNTRLRKMVADGSPEGTVAIAEVQTAGKGRLGKQWVSPMGTGIWMSLLLRPEVSPSEAPLLTLLAGLSVCHAIGTLTSLNAEIKWPNDILMGGKKVCGILTEMDTEMDQINGIVVGMGINVNTEKFPDELQEIATSLKLENGGQEVSRTQLVQAILKEFERVYERYQKEQGFLAFYEEYKARCITMGKEVRVLGREPFEGIAVDITPQGELVVRKENGDEVVVFSGEVSIRNKEQKGELSWKK